MSKSTPVSSRSSKQSTLINESTPLLGPAAAQDPSAEINEGVIQRHGNGHEVADQNGTAVSVEDKPIPWSQIFLLCYARLIEPIAFFSIFPFVNDMIRNTGGVPEEDCGFYSGLIESLFSITQMLLMIPWGKAADRFGRKPILVFSLAGVSIASALFGVSRSVWQMIMFRCFAGLFAGSIVTIRAMISENSTQKTQARTFSFFGFAGNVGIVIGPMIGGALAKPAETFPGIFGEAQFFKDYPYALASFVTGAVGMTAVVTSALFVKETLPPKRSDAEDASTSEPRMTTWELLRNPGVKQVLVVYGLVMLLALAYTAVAPVFQFTSPALGGLGFTTLEIATFLGIAGVSQSLWTLLVFPPLQQRFGTNFVLRLCSYAWPLFFLLNPFGVYLFRAGVSKTIVFTLFGIATAIGSGVSMAFTCVQLAVNDIAPNHRSLGTLNGVALTLTSMVRAFAPALFTSIFATGVRLHILGGMFVWVFLLLICLFLIIALLWLPADEKPEEEET